MTKAITMEIQASLKEAKNLRFCIRCNHVEKACICKSPVWVSQEVASNKTQAELRRLPFKKIRRAFPRGEADE